MAATPVYSNGTWGSVVAVVHEGETITPETVGEVITEDRQTTFEKEGCLPVTVTNRVSFEAIKPWDVLEAAGLLPDLTPIPEPDEVKLVRLKAEKQAALDTAWKAAEATGVNVNGIYFGIAQGDVSLLTGAFVLAQTAVSLGAASADGPFTLIDVSGQSHSFTFAELTQTMLLYGNARATWSQTYAETKAAIDAASTVAQIEAIVVPSFE
jgi:hypothetical protein